MKVTSTHMLIDNESNKYPQLPSNNSKSSQEKKLMYAKHLQKQISKKETREKKKEKKMQMQVIIEVPFGENNLPKRIAKIKLNKGRNIISKNISNLLTNLYIQ